MTHRIPNLLRSRKLLTAPPLTLLLLWTTFHCAVAWLPYPQIIDRSPPTATLIQDRNGTQLAAFAASNGDWQLPLTESEITPHLFNAIVAVEDSRFFQHTGVDWRSASAAVWQDLSTLSQHRGASTITMQLYRLRDPAPRSLPNKLIQTIRATQIEQHTSKQSILVEYLNRAPFGANLVGAGAASWRYFNRPCHDLSLGQAALLAGLPQSPNRFRPDRHPAEAAARRSHVLDRMFALGMITAQEQRTAANEPIDATWHPLPQSISPPDGLLPTLTLLAQHNPGPLIRTTIDIAAQHRTAAATSQWLHSLAASRISAAAVIVLDTESAQCLAAVSCTENPSEDSDAIDLTTRPRSSGSTLKPFIYAAAFDAGICTPRSMLDDSPSSWTDYEPKNYDLLFHGPIPAAEALAQSRNIPALTLLSKVGLPRAIEVMRAMGLTTLSRTPDRYGLPLALGGAEVTPMELAQAYATLARAGRYKPISLLQNDHPTETAHSILRPEICRQTLSCLADPERTKNISPSAATLSPAWKTGTSSGHRDAWCAAVTPRRTVVVWLGNPDGSGSDRLIGQQTAAPLALKILTTEDPGGPTSFFTTTPTQTSPPIPQTDPPTLIMLSPIPGQEIIQDTDLPTNRQLLPLRAKKINDDTPAEIWWFIDGQCIAHCPPGESYLWPPTPGSHEVRAVDRQGHVALANVLVR
jgi:penicillin-binding protein 1C